MHARHRGRQPGQAVPETVAPTPVDRRPGGLGRVLARKSRPDDLLTGLARGNGSNTDPRIRQDLVRLYTLNELGRLNAERLKATREAGGDIPGMANIAKLSMSAVMRLTRDLGLRIVGARACSTPTIRGTRRH